MSLLPPGPAHAAGYARGVADADAVELTPDMKRKFLSGTDSDPEELSPRSPLSGELAGDSLNELLGEGYDDDAPEQYEQGYLLGWEERLLQRSMENDV